MRRTFSIVSLAAAMALGMVGAAGRKDAAQAVPVLPIVMSPHVGNWGIARADWAPWVVRPEDFVAQMDWLRAHGYRTVTFREWFAETAGGRRPDGKPVILSFDDGWAEHAGIARDLLEPRGMHAVLFVFTGAVGPKRNGSGYISWEELHELESRGHEVQSHTVSHGRLTQMLPAQVAWEMRESKSVIEREMRHPCQVVAYPYGDHDRATIQAAHDAGYELAVRADDDPASGPAHRLRMPRVRVGYGDGIEVFAAAMERASAADDPVPAVLAPAAP